MKCTLPFSLYIFGILNSNLKFVMNCYGRESVEHKRLVIVATRFLKNLQT